MLSTDAFAAWSKKAVLFLHVTSHCDDEPYPDLLFQKGGNGFPTVSFLDASGQLMKQVGHITPVAQIEEAYQDLAAWRKLRAEVAAGATERAKDLFMMEIQNGYVSFAEASKKRQELKLSDAEKTEAQPLLVNLEFRDILCGTPRTDMASGGAKFYAMLQAKRIPSSAQATSFWQYMFEDAKQRRDVPRYREILGELRARMSGDPRFARYIGMLERGLSALEKAAAKPNKDG